MELQQQPTKTSCGPTVVAMLAGVPAREVIAKVRTVRSDARGGKRTHATNVAELGRLLGAYGRRLGRRFIGAPPEAGVYILRLQRRSGSWHWAAMVWGKVYDPARTAPAHLAEYQHLHISYYEIWE